MKLIGFFVAMLLGLPLPAIGHNNPGAEKELVTLQGVPLPIEVARFKTGDVLTIVDLYGDGNLDLVSVTQEGIKHFEVSDTEFVDQGKLVIVIDIDGDGDRDTVIAFPKGIAIEKNYVSPELLKNYVSPVQ